MKIEFKTQNASQNSSKPSAQKLSFKAAYFDMRSLQNYGKGKKQIIQALKEKNTPLRRFINDTFNKKETEKILGDVFIRFKKTKLPYEGQDLFDTAVFEFPKLKENRLNKILDKFSKFFAQDKDKEFLSETIAHETDYVCGFRDYDRQNSADLIIGSGFQNGTHKLVKYLTGNEIVRDLKEHMSLLLK